MKDERRHEDKWQLHVALVHPSSFIPSPFRRKRVKGCTVPRRGPGACSGALLALMAGGAVVPPRLAAQTCSPDPRPLVVLLNGTVRLQMLTKKRIRAVTNPKEGVLTIRTIEGDPASVILVGVGAGITRLELEDVDGGKEVREVVVQADVEHLTAQLRRAVPSGQRQPSRRSATPPSSLSGYVQRPRKSPSPPPSPRAAASRSSTACASTACSRCSSTSSSPRCAAPRAATSASTSCRTRARQILGSTIGNLIQAAPTTAVGVPSGVAAAEHLRAGDQLHPRPRPTSSAASSATTPASSASCRRCETEGLAKILGRAAPGRR